MIPEHCTKCREQVLCTSCGDLLCEPTYCECFKEERDCASCNEQSNNRTLRGHYKTYGETFCSKCYNKKRNPIIR